MASPPAAHNALEPWLDELERLGLVRPASVLLTEYLAALTRENVIDAGAARQIAAAYHRVRYGAVDRNDLEERAAIESLKAAAAGIGGLPQAERQSLAERVASRLQPQQAERAPLPAPALDPAPLTRKAEPLRPIRFEELPNATAGAIGHQPSERPDAGSSVDSGFDSESPQAERRGGFRIRSLPLETATLVVVGLIFCGYVLRNSIDRTIGPGQAQRRAENPASGRAHVIARDVWRNEDYWAANLRRRAQDLAARQHDHQAELAYELLLADVPRDAGALNDLAWLYLTTNDPAVRNPKRGLELALRALAITRQPQILDTAAEARFQNGQPAEAVKLEQEALDSFPRFQGFQDKRFWNILHQQLEKFQKAAASPAAR